MAIMEANLRHKLLEIERQLEEERRQPEEVRRQREEVEELAKASQPQTLQPYLEACHSLDLAIRIVTNPSSTTQGEATSPTGRIFPRRIIPWHDFAAKQEGIWNRLSIGESFSSQPNFPSPNQLEYVLSVLHPPTGSVSGEGGQRGGGGLHVSSRGRFEVRRVASSVALEPKKPPASLTRPGTCESCGIGLGFRCMLKARGRR
jgi:hypothetical protein